MPHRASAVSRVPRAMVAVCGGGCAARGGQARVAGVARARRRPLSLCQRDASQAATALARTRRKPPPPPAVRRIPARAPGCCRAGRAPATARAPSPSFVPGRGRRRNSCSPPSGRSIAVTQPTSLTARDSGAVARGRSEPPPVAPGRAPHQAPRCPCRPYPHAPGACGVRHCLFETAAQGLRGRAGSAQAPAPCSAAPCARPRSASHPKPPVDRATGQRSRPSFLLQKPWRSSPPLPPTRRSP